MSKVAYIRLAHVILPCFAKNLRTTVLETGFNNLEKIWAHFPVSVQQKYLGAWNHFSYISTRKLNLFDRLTIQQKAHLVSNKNQIKKPNLP